MKVPLPYFYHKSMKRMKTEKITFSLQCIKEILLCILLLATIICIFNITYTYCTLENCETKILERELIRKQIISFEWDENNRDYYENAY